jgi:PPOX class probable F420-dependent enzyme
MCPRAERRHGGLMPGQDELWELVAGNQQGVLATVNADRSPQLSNVLYVADPATRTIRVSTTADRAKGRNLARDPRAALHVSGEDFWHYAVAEGPVTLSDVAAIPGDDAVEELLEVHSFFYGEIDRATFEEEMITNQRLVVRLQVSHLYGVMVKTGRRPVTK